MLTVRAGATVFALFVATSFAIAQTPAQTSSPPSKSAPASATKQDRLKSNATKPGSASTTSSATDSVKQGAEDVKNWTEKQWNSMKAEWRKNKVQWNSCNDRAKAKHLKGKDSWSFVYDCMKA
jgi:hypothetical protein